MVNSFANKLGQIALESEETCLTSSISSLINPISKYPSIFVCKKTNTYMNDPFTQYYQSFCGTSESSNSLSDSALLASEEVVALDVTGQPTKLQGLTTIFRWTKTVKKTPGLTLENDRNTPMPSMIVFPCELVGLYQTLLALSVTRPILLQQKNIIITNQIFF